MNERLAGKAGLDLPRLPAGFLNDYLEISLAVQPEEKPAGVPSMRDVMAVVEANSGGG